jgi:hypothetical protein
MNLKERFLQITEFLKPYQNIWENEIMLRYPNPLEGYPQDWIDELMEISELKTLLEIERKNVEGHLKNETLLKFFRDVLTLCEVPKAASLTLAPTSKTTFLYVIPKKEHEIRHLAPYIAKFAQDHSIERLIDIGGGIGLLAQTVNSLYGTPITSVDMDEKLQKTGQERLKKLTLLSAPVEYECLKVDPSEIKFKALLGPHRATIGLHTCGGLAVTQIKTSIEQNCKGVINFGCCYHKLLPHEQNLSEFARQNGGIEFNQFALTLSARAHKKFSLQDMELKWKVKFFRYTFHFIMCDHHDQWNTLNLGNSHKSLYEKSFAEYALDQFERIGVKSKLSYDELNNYFEREENKKLIRQMLSAALIRDALSRLLELYLLIDRCLYLEEQGHQTQLLSFFDETISPRDLGIISIKTT